MMNRPTTCPSTRAARRHERYKRDNTSFVSSSSAFSVSVSFCATRRRSGCRIHVRANRGSLRPRRAPFASQWPYIVRLYAILWPGRRETVWMTADWPGRIWRLDGGVRRTWRLSSRHGAGGGGDRYETYLNSQCGGRRRGTSLEAWGERTENFGARPDEGEGFALEPRRRRLWIPSGCRDVRAQRGSHERRCRRWSALSSFCTSAMRAGRSRPVIDGHGSLEPTVPEGPCSKRATTIPTAIPSTMRCD